jgi:hypothetical protein
LAATQTAAAELAELAAASDDAAGGDIAAQRLERVSCNLDRIRATGNLLLVVLPDDVSDDVSDDVLTAVGSHQRDNVFLPGAA